MNENPEGLPSTFHRRVLRKVTPELLAMYPEPEDCSKELSRYLGVPVDSLFLSNGSDESIKTIFEVYGEEGASVVTVTPTFEMYGVYAKMFHMVHVPVPYGDDWKVGVNEVLVAIDAKTRLVAVLNPNNPIGTVFSESEVRQILEKARSVGALVVLDEAYHYFYDKTLLSLVGEYDNVLLTRTFSKLCSVAGLRIGYTVGSPRLIGGLEKVRQTFNVNTVALLFATEILRDPTLIPRLQKVEREGRAFLLQELSRSGIAHYAENGNYVFIACRGRAAEVAKALEDRKVLVKTYGHPLLRDYIRITTGSVRVMKRFWKHYQDLEVSRG
jgi:histidinol-phosphate aminotransferase